jgi:hypothetical protein
MDHHDNLRRMGSLIQIALCVLLVSCVSADFRDIDAQRRAARIAASEAMFHKTHEVRRSCSPRRHRPRNPSRRARYTR